MLFISKQNPTNGLCHVIAPELSSSAYKELHSPAAVTIHNSAKVGTFSVAWDNWFKSLQILANNL